MTVPTSNRFDSVASAGASSGGSGLVPFISNLDPLPSNITGPNGPFRLGQKWVNPSNNTTYELTSYSAFNGIVTANWEVASSSSTLATLTASSGGALSPTGGNINILGTANEITTAGSGSTITLSIPSVFDAPGTITSQGAITANVGSVLAPSGSLSALGNLILTGPASKLLISAAAPATASVGFFTALGASTFTLTSSAITANSQIFFQLKTLGTVSVASSISYISTSGDAVLTLSQNTDTSTYAYLIIN